jgi:hypothetical protein
MRTLAEIYANYSAPNGWGDKGTTHDYLPIYERHIDRRSKVSLCEIGVFYGHSIAMWNEYLEDSEIHGCDVTLHYVSFDVPNLHLLDSTDPEQVKHAFADKRFDYIIDDGDHSPRAQLATFDCFWPYLKEGGTYFIEDIESDQALEAIVNRLGDIKHVVYDNRSIIGRFDEIVVVAFK